MNVSMILYILCWVLQIEGIFLALPCITALVYRESGGWAFLGVMAVCLLIGTLGKCKKPKSQRFYAKEGFVTVSLSWVVLSLFGALPFTISGAIPSYVDALFETISGFTTTGASILSEVESLEHCVLFWRSFTHWLGGMGVLVFVLTVLPLAGGSNMHLMRAESTGPAVGKLVPRLRHTAQILYGIYFTMTITQIVALLIAGMPAFDALTLSFGTAGTGGFGVRNDSIASYTALQQNIITIYMILFGINFNLYYLILIHKAKQAFGSEELHTYLGIILAAIVIITWSIKDSFASIFVALRHAAFQVASIITTTGYSTLDYDVWPQTAKVILLILMFIGACAGSTGGGIKVSRILIYWKACREELYRIAHPRAVRRMHMEGRVVEKTTIHSTERFLLTYIFLFTASLLVLSLDHMDFTGTFTAVAATLNNIGPGFHEVGPAENFGSLSVVSKLVLMFDMLAGRLELFPMLILFAPSTWQNK